MAQKVTNLLSILESVPFPPVSIYTGREKTGPGNSRNGTKRDKTGSNKRPFICALSLAILATGIAMLLSILAGLERGGLPAERTAWVAIGVLLAIAAHLLPALCRGARLSHRALGMLIWTGCMTATCYGHAVFFLMAQQHAGDLRANAVIVPASVTPTGRDLAAIANARANLVAELAHARSNRTVLRARIAALDAEATEAQRREAATDRITAAQERADTRRDELRSDPVTGRLATLLKIPTSRLDLLTGLLMAAVLECVACLCWSLALDRSPITHALKTASRGHGAGSVTASVTEPVTVGVTDRERVAEAISTCKVRCTVAEIRRFLGCSQARAMELRRELARTESTNEVNDE